MKNQINPEIIDAFIEAFSGDESFIRENISLSNVRKSVNIHISEIPSLHQFGLKFLIYFIEYSQLYRFSRFSKLPLSKRENFISKWSNNSFSSVRLLFLLFKSVFIGSIYSEHQLLSKIGYTRAMNWRFKEQGMR